MRKNKIINFGEDFKRKTSILEYYNYFNEFKTLRDCYDSWSGEKERIYNYYRNLLNDNTDKVINYGIRSYSGWIITLHAIVIKDGVKYYLLITPSYNYYIELNEQ